MEKKRVLLVNKFYYPRGGDCIQMMSLEQLLKAKGHDVAVFSMNYPQNINSGFSSYFPSEVNFSGGLSAKISAVKRVFGKGDVVDRFQKILQDFKPDIVHLHNIHSYISPVVARIAKRRGCKVVWTLHDYKLACPSYSCLCNGNPCELCLTDKISVLKNRCMKGSLSASAIAYLEACYWSIKKLCKYTDAFICPSCFMEGMMEKCGVPNNKLHVLCNFIDSRKLEIFKSLTDEKREDYYCYVGRLSAEKGVETLLDAASRLPYTLKIAGGGPLFEVLKAKYERDNIVFLGHLPSDKVAELLAKARFSVIPSECYENNPLGVIESLCAGTPVLGSNIGGIPELINDSNGMLFNAFNRDDLKTKISMMFNQNRFENNKIAVNSGDLFDSDKYFEKLLRIYYKNIS